MAKMPEFMVKVTFGNSKQKAIEGFIEWAKDNLCEKDKVLAAKWLYENIKIVEK
jgi:hypothetical protein